MRFTLVDSSTDIQIHQVDFQPPGGTIGRSNDNDLVLPDPERAISRLQALVHVAPSGECRLTSHGNVMPVVRNGRTLTRGEQVALRHGDALTIGQYQLKINDPTLQAGVPTDDPLAFFARTESENEGDSLALFEQAATAAIDPLAIFSADMPEEPAVAAESVSTSLASASVSASQPTTDKPPAPHAQPQSIPAESDVRTGRAANARLSIDPIQHDEPASHTPAAGVPDDTRLITALLEGMGLDNPQNTVLNEEQVRTTGRMLSLYSQGMVALLSSRSILKRGVKAEMTMILNEANNPFKILPSGKTVLMQMYQSQMPGFMPPEQAVRDALVDLQAHQLGMIAGIRAIIAAMLQSFNPLRLEEHARQNGAIPRMSLSNKKKAALWDHFSRHYQHTAGELEDDFHTLFGEAFLHAYDMEVHQYKDSQMPTDER